jgi:ribosomal protein S7
MIEEGKKRNGKLITESFKKKITSNKQSKKLIQPKKPFIKDKLINHIMFEGEKETSEKLLIKSCKELQRSFNKQSKKLIQLAIVRTTPIFKLHVSENKRRKKRKKKTIRETPVYISTATARMSQAIKFIISSTVQKKSIKFSKKLYQEFVLASQSKGNSIETKNMLQKKIALKKNILKHFRV